LRDIAFVREQHAEIESGGMQQRRPGVGGDPLFIQGDFNTGAKGWPGSLDRRQDGFERSGLETPANSTRMPWCRETRCQACRQTVEPGRDTALRARCACALDRGDRRPCSRASHAGRLVRVLDPAKSNLPKFKILLMERYGILWKGAQVHGAARHLCEAAIVT
jgi:hypothetical protein